VRLVAMDGARRHVVLMVVPLAVIALGLIAQVFVPYTSPLKWMPVVTQLDELSPFHVIHVGAGTVAVAIVLAHRRGTAPGVVAVVAALLAILAGTIMTAITVKVAADASYWTFVFAFTAPIVFALVLAFNALRLRGWDRMLLLLGAFAIAVAPYGCPLVPGM